MSGRRAEVGAAPGPADDRVAVGLPAPRLPRRGAAGPDRADPVGRRSELPPGVGDPIRSFLDHLESTPLPELQADYVETFDSRRRCNLFLTYFAHGDTRKRGMALLRFKQTYLGAGFELDDGELPDHLCVVLEFAATVDHDLGRDLMLDHRAGLELLRLSLRDLGSPWASLVDAVTATLPPLRGDERDAVRRLAAEGPPEEEVGLAPFAAPQFSPGAPPAPRPCCPCRRSQEPAHERVPVRRRPLRLPDDVRRRAPVALPLRQVRVDHQVLPALREPAAADRQPAVPLRHARGRRRPRHRAARPAVVDGRGRDQRAHLPRGGCRGRPRGRA